MIAAAAIGEDDIHSTLVDFEMRKTGSRISILDHYRSALVVRSTGRRFVGAFLFSDLLAILDYRDLQFAFLTLCDDGGKCIVNSVLEHKDK